MLADKQHTTARDGDAGTKRQGKNERMLFGSEWEAAVCASGFNLEEQEHGSLVQCLII